MLFKLLNGNWTELGARYAAGTLAAGTQLTLIATGSTLTFAANGVVRISATDTSLTGGAPGIMANGAATAGNWAGGNADDTYTIGGAVSGLTGTVVLQDNNGDNLTLTANGTFTFATALADTATYYVSVQTNPSAQICTVTNGSGSVIAANISNVTVTCTGSGGTGGGTTDGVG